MRHRDHHKRPGQNSCHRRQLLRNLASSLVQNGRIVTTITKAKSLRKHLEPLITKGRTKTVSNIRTIRSGLSDGKAANKIFGVLGPKYSLTAGGYVRIVRVKVRAGDGTTQSLIELVQ